MSMFNNLTIRKKILITAVSLILIIAAIKVYEFAFLKTLETAIVSNLDKNWKSLQYSRELEAYFYLSATAVSNYAITDDTNWLAIEKDSKDQFTKAINNIKNNSKYPEDFSKTINEIDRLTKTFYTDTDNIIYNDPSQLSSYLKKNNSQITQIIYNCKKLVSYSQRFITDNSTVLKIIFNNTKLLTLLTSFLMLIITLSMIYIQIRLLLSPLSELLNGVKLIWAGDTDHMINIQTKDEIGELANVFNLMATSIHREQKRLFEKATTDEMTGLFNFRYFQEAVEKEFENASRFNHNLSFIILDVDFFKFYNDTNGHQAGDQVLKAIAKVVENSCRDKDIPARYGGEEFVVILPSTPLDAAIKVAERIRMAVENVPIIYKEKQPNKNLTVSLGVSNYPIHAKTVKDLVKQADSALYDAKTTGKNKVCIAKEKT